MNPADRTALRDRIAHATAWTDLTDVRKNDYRRKAAAILDEIETAKVQLERIGWILIEVEPTEVEP